MPHWVRFSTLATLLFMLVATGAHAQMTFETNINRPGGDIRRFQTSANPTDCQQACVRESKCVAWTYVRATPPLCYLKRAPQTPVPAAGVISGVVRPVAAAPQTYETNTNRPGGDLRNFPTGADPRACQQACSADGRCRAWTYSRATPQRPPLCWLKASAPRPRPEACCVSGVTR